QAEPIDLLRRTNMIPTQRHWLRYLLSAIAAVVALGGSFSVKAQGLGPDPFRPFNSDYDKYTYPLAPTTPEGGAGGQFPRSGLRGANQFQDYLNELQGAERQGSERYGIGLPYFRSSVDPRFDRAGNREYRPNRLTDRTFEETQELITQKYFAYFTEKDP